MASSIRNEIQGTIKSIRKCEILAEILLETPAGEIASIISSRSVDDLALSVGDTVCAQIKATNVSICKCNCEHHD